ncbi:hypothetical protein HG619_17935 [Pseudomonas syringae]|nr:hypothetical protein [Pseudomonas syringae]
MRGGKKGDGEFHDRLCQQNMRNDKEFKGRRVSLARVDRQALGRDATVCAGLMFNGHQSMKT